VVLRSVHVTLACPPAAGQLSPAVRNSDLPPVPPLLRSSGSVEVITGSMFSGKTEELIRRLKRALFARQRVQAFKPRIDDRYDPSRIVSHQAVAVDAVAVATSQSLEERVLEGTQVVAIDEAQFFDRGIVEVCERLANRGIRVIAAGLDQDYLGRPFPPMPDLMAIAEEVTKVHAVCTVCGGPASRSQRLSIEASTVLVGGAESYEARCRACFEARDVPRTER
jgi:thymidine kinase